jgi:N6-L-threonylcarbamoyladenine synthase
MQANKLKTILAIETSCDETAAAILHGVPKANRPNFKILASIVRSQMKLHSKYGGVVPELQARAHVASIRPVVEQALTVAFPKLKSNKARLAKLDYIAVTAGPGLIASLLVGVEFAKGLSFAQGVPIIATNHMEGHLYSPFGLLEQKAATTQNSNNALRFPILSMVVSGGHTLLVLQKNEGHYEVLGTTVDDAAGEAFDKVAKLLELPYPGGPQISKLAEEGKDTIPFPRPMAQSKDYNFSFSGLKTAVLYHLKETYPPKTTNKKTNLHSYHYGYLPLKEKANIARSFEEAVVDVLVTKALRACKQYTCKTISLSGGVAANKRLRATLKSKCVENDLDFIVPDFRLCTDNAEMIAIASYFKLRNGYAPVPYSQVRANSAWEL